MIPPLTLQTYVVSTGRISCSSSTGLISKAPTNDGRDTTALLSFQLPRAAARNKMC
ncbi:hypothetical protein B0T18DRAFT_409757 [Schizothecium vesticola]|uniref:Uncharacterized protein n=1 Tax=Schizothecium vesticola TaxID=314040 RepID=A0AA40EU63_9PEZI|nr:hypothetical protein B0T18DRAFT_409757 [Schizothecium vesticola]